MELVSTAPALALPVRHTRTTLVEGGVGWWLRTGFLCGLIVITCRVFAVSHLLEIIGVVEGLSSAVFVAWAGWRLLERWLLNDWKVTGLEIYCIALAFVPLWSAINAQRVFGQPVIYGLVAFKDFYLFLGAVHTYRLLRQGYFTLKQLELAFLIVAWTAVAYFYFASLFIDPGPWLDTPLAGANEIKGAGAYYRFNMMIIFFGAIYYTARAFLRQQWIYLLHALVFMSYVIFFRVDRTSIVVMLLGSAGAVLLHAKAKVLARFALVGLLPVLLGGVLVVQLAPGVVDQYTTMFGDAINTVLSDDKEGGEVSVRAYEVLIAERHIERAPLLGSGRMGSQWIEGGYEHFLGYFFPADVGYLGLVFMYGWPVTIFMYAQFILGAVYLLRAKGRSNDIFHVACKFLVLAVCLDSLTNGFLTQFAGQAMLLTSIAHHYSRVHRTAALA
ncbi:MAG: hypothetical protein ABI599_14315 [Flavobacteriales bacterium]